MKKATIFVLFILMNIIGAYTQIKVWADGKFSAGTTISTGNSSSGYANRMYIEAGGDYRALCMKAYHSFDWYQSISAQVGRQYTVSYVVRFNNVDKFYVRGDGMVLANGVWLGSDAKLKTNVKPIDDALDKVLKLQGVTYNLKKEELTDPEATYIPDTSTYIGFIAQDVEKVVPEVVREMKDGIKAVAYQNLTGLLVEAIKEQQAQIDQMEQEIKNLQQMLNISRNSKTILYQNKPNPFNDITTIEYELNQDNITNAFIYVYDLNGTQKLSFELPKTIGRSQIQINARTLKAGMYLYSLIVNDMEIDTKKMIITD